MNTEQSPLRLSASAGKITPKPNTKQTAIHSAPQRLCGENRPNTEYELGALILRGRAGMLGLHFVLRVIPARPPPQPRSLDAAALSQTRNHRPDPQHSIRTSVCGETASPKFQRRSASAQSPRDSPNASQVPACAENSSRKIPR